MQSSFHHLFVKIFTYKLPRFYNGSYYLKIPFREQMYEKNRHVTSDKWNAHGKRNMRNSVIPFFLIFCILGSSLLGGFTVLPAMADNGSIVFTDSNSTSVSNTQDSTTVTVSPNSATANPGSSVTLTVTVSDTSNLSATPTGTMLWTDNGAGGTFNPPACALSSGSCTTSYTPSASSSSVTITASYGGDSTHATSSGTSTLTTNQLDLTSTTITPNSAVLPSNGTLTFTVQASDTSSSPTALSGTISFSDNNAGGTFNPSSCALPSGTCVTTYATSTNPLNAITINATYSGDSTHLSSSATSQISTSQLDATTTTVTPNSETFTPGTAMTVTATVADTSNPSSSTIGIISWSDNGAGGIFNPPACALSSGNCTTSYTPSATSSAVTITASYGGDSTHATSSGTSTLTTNQLDLTSTTITPNSAVLPSNGTLTFTVQASDTSSSPTALSGTISFSDNNAGGTFNPSSCALPSGTCVTTYATSTNPLNAITINATYSGDSTHLSSSATSQISTSQLDATTTTVTPNSETFTPGTAMTVTATVADTSNPSSSTIGIISWSDNGAGGIFSPNVCILANNQCALTYTPPTASSSGITITATYAGDSSHSGSSGTSSLSVSSSALSSTPSSSSSTPSTTQSTPSTSTPSSSSSTPSTTQSTPSTSTPSSSSSTPSTTQSTPSTSTPSSSSSTPSTTQSTPSTSTPSSSSSTPSTTQSTPSTSTPSSSSSTPSTTQSTPSTTSAPSSNQKQTSSVAAINQVVNTPEEIFSNIISMIESIFQKL